MRQNILFQNNLAARLLYRSMISFQLRDAVDNWIEMWEPYAAAEVILSSDVAKKCTRMDSSVVYRGVSLSSSKLKKLVRGELLQERVVGSFIVYSFDKDAAYNAVADFAIEDASIVVFEKSISQSDIVLNFSQFLEEIQMTDVVPASEAEVWLKVSSYLYTFNIDDAVLGIELPSHGDIKIN